VLFENVYKRQTAQFGIAATEQFRNRIKGAKEALSRGDALLQKCRATSNPETRKTCASARRVGSEVSSERFVLKGACASLNKETTPDKAASLLASARSAIESAQAIIDTDTELATSAVDCDRRTGIGDERSEQCRISVQVVGLLDIRGKGRDSGAEPVLNVVQV